METYPSIQCLLKSAILHVNKNSKYQTINKSSKNITAVKIKFSMQTIFCYGEIKSFKKRREQSLYIYFTLHLHRVVCCFEWMYLLTINCYTILLASSKNIYLSHKMKSYFTSDVGYFISPDWRPLIVSIQFFMQLFVPVDRPSHSSNSRYNVFK